MERDLAPVRRLHEGADGGDVDQSVRGERTHDDAARPSRHRGPDVAHLDVEVGGREDEAARARPDEHVHLDAPTGASGLRRRGDRGLDEAGARREAARRAETDAQLDPAGMHGCGHADAVGVLDSELEGHVAGRGALEVGGRHGALPSSGPAAVASHDPHDGGRRPG